MSRYHFQGRTRDSNGNIVPNLDITITLTETSENATVFTSYTGGSGISTAPQIKSDSNGYFSFYVDDNIHDPYTLFDISAAGINYTYIDIFRRGKSGTSGTSGTSGSSGSSGVGVPEGGNYTDILSKASDDDYDTEWIDSSSFGINGGVFITDINASDDGNVGSKVYSDDGNMLISCTSDTNNLTVDVLAITGHSNYTPIVTVNGNDVELTESSTLTIFTGSVDIVLDGETEIIAEHEDGSSDTATVSIESKPVIQSAEFTGGYPGTQTEIKENDTFDINIQTDVDIVVIEIDNYGAFKSKTFSVVSGNNHTVTGDIADRGNTTQDLGAKVRVQKSTGSWSDWYLTEDDGSVDGVNLVKLNNLHPSISIGSITYPPGQNALKDNESADVANNVSDYDVILYSSPNNQLNISNTSTYESSKNVNRIDGDYNVSTDNFTITATRNANDSTANESTVVYIANTSCTVDISVPYTRLRSGGNDGTSAQDYTVTITSDQNLLSSPTLDAGQGTWQGAGFAGSGTTWTRNLQIHDDDVKGSYSFSNLSATNLAGIETTTISSGSTYTLGGFVSRDIALDAFANETEMNTAATEYTKVTLSWSFKASVTDREPLDSDPPVVDAWCLVALNTNPTTIRILDTAATDSSSQESTITIEETV